MGLSARCARTPAGLTVVAVHTPAPFPLVSAFVVVPTAVADNRGLPHTLEHIVFCGSAAHPRRGVLDRAATLCASAGTNAYTSEDHTCYTAATAGAAGMAVLLPLLLDHVLRPVVGAETFSREVFRCEAAADGARAGRGVVYCEMQAREWSEDDVVDGALRGMLYGAARGLATYAWECGGLTRDIARLSPADVAAYHARHYVPHAVSVLLCGHGDAFRSLDWAAVVEAAASGAHPLLLSAGERCRVESLIRDSLAIAEYGTGSVARESTPMALTTPVVSDDADEADSSKRTVDDRAKRPCLTDPLPGGFKQGSNFTGHSRRPNAPQAVDSCVIDWDPPVSDDELRHRMERRGDYDPRAGSRSVRVRFPSGDESLGTVALAWRGPAATDARGLAEAHVVLRMLCDTSASPLYQRYVEVPEPAACDVEFDVRPYAEAMVTLTFVGVPAASRWAEAGVLYEDMAGAIGDWLQNEDAVALRAGLAISQMLRRLAAQLEDDPHDVVAACVVPALVMRARTGVLTDMDAALGGTAAALRELRTRPASFWAARVRGLVLDVRPVEARSAPSAAMADEVARLEAAHLAAVPDVHHSAVLPLAMAAGAPVIDAILAAAATDSGQRMDAKGSAVYDFPSRPLISYRCTQPGALDMGVPHTCVAHVSAAFSLRGIPAHLRPLLVLFQEMLFKADVRSGPLAPELIRRNARRGAVPYQALLDALSAEYTAFGGAVGLGNAVFSADALDSHLVVSISAVSESHGAHVRAEMEALASWVPLHTRITEARVAEVAESVVSQLREAWRDPAQVMDARLTQALDDAAGESDPDSGCAGRDISIVAQTALLSGGRRALAKRLCALQSHLSSPDLCVFFSASDLQQPSSGGAEPAVDHGRRASMKPMGGNNAATLGTGALVAGSGKSASTSGLSKTESGTEPTHSPYTSLSAWRPEYRLPRYGHVSFDSSGFVELIPMADVTSSFLSVTLPINVRPMDIACTDTHANAEDALKYLGTVRILCSMASYTEGALWQRIRGAGLAYDASLTLDSWAGLLTLAVNDTADPAAALGAASSLLSELAAECAAVLGGGEKSNRYVTTEALCAARAQHVFFHVTDRASPSALCATAVRCHLRGLPLPGTAAEDAALAATLAADLADVARTARPLLLALASRLSCFSVAAVPAARLSEIVAAFDAASIAHTVNSSFVPSSLLE